MTMREFIKIHKDEVDRAIRGACPNCRLSEAERREWIANDEGLYLWARSEGVRI